MVTVYVIDDNQDILKTLTSQLKVIFPTYLVHTFQSGTEALKKMKRKAPDLVLLDIMMPGIDGWETAAQIRSEEVTKETPIIFVTAKSDPISVQIGSITSDDYLQKPVDMKTLETCITNVLKK